jgi:hypothetical protein
VTNFQASEANQPLFNDVLERHIARQKILVDRFMAHVLPPAQWCAGERIGRCDMVANLIEQQEREWLALYSQIRALLQRFGKEDDGSDEKDYLLVGDNLGLWQHRRCDLLAATEPILVPLADSCWFSRTQYPHSGRN